MTKQELMDEIYRMDPSYIQLKIDLNKFTEEELQVCYNRKKFSPVKQQRGGWYSNYTPRGSSRVTTAAERNTARTDGFEEVEYTPKEKKPESIALTGFDALRKE